MFDDCFTNRDQQPTEFRDFSFVAEQVPVEHPSEPVLVVFADGGIEWMHAGDATYVDEGRPVLTAYTIDDVLGSLHGFIQSNRPE